MGGCWFVVVPVFVGFVVCVGAAAAVFMAAMFVVVFVVVVVF